MSRSIKHIAMTLLAAFFLIALASGYWGINRRSALLARDDNPRQVLAEQQIRRGQIIDRNGTVLVESHLLSDDDTVQRVYHYPEAAAATGYYSFRYGESGVEAEFNNVLRGDDALSQDDKIRMELLHQPQIGGDVQLTIDLEIQQAADQMLAGHRGAIVVLSVPQGQILGMVSHPIFDPNNLDENWDTLTDDPQAPLVNRVTQGDYQPGTILQSVFMAAAYNTRLLDPTDIYSPPYSVNVNGATLPCIIPPTKVGTLVDAYLQACPGPFQESVQQLGVQQFRLALEAFYLLEPHPFAEDEEDTSPVVFKDLSLEVVGQGQLTVSPLHMAMVAAAFADDGRMPSLQLVQAIRHPDQGWQSVPPVSHPKGTVSRDSAIATSNLMIIAVSEGAAQPARVPDITTYGHTGLAVSSMEGSLNAWFIGFIRLENDDAIAIAVLVEDVTNPNSAAEIGGQVLQVAAEALGK